MNDMRAGLPSSVLYDASLEAEAERALIACKGDREGAADTLAAAILKDAGLTALSVRALARYMVNDVARALHFRKAGAKARKAAERVRAALGGILRSWPLSSGILLADATREDLRREITFLRQTSRGLQVKMTFLVRVASGLRTDAQTVGEVFSEKDIERFLKDAEKKVPAI